MSLAKKIKDLALITGLSAAIAGCASNTQNTLTDSDREFKNQRAKAINVLKTSDLEYLPRGYITDRWGKSDLVNAAGVLAGTMEIVKIEDGYLSTGTYSQLENPEALIVAAKHADVNNDKIVTEKESRNFYSRFCEKYARSNEDE